MMIKGVQGTIVSFEAKYKLGQNRSDDDFHGIYNNLISKDPENKMAAIMKKYFKSKLSA